MLIPKYFKCITRTEIAEMEAKITLSVFAQIATHWRLTIIAILLNSSRCAAGTKRNAPATARATPKNFRIFPPTHSLCVTSLLTRNREIHRRAGLHANAVQQPHVV
jgi:hypothetical protein